MLRFKAIIEYTRCSIKRPLFPLGGLSFSRFAFARTATLVAGVATTVQCNTTVTEALRRLHVALMADGRESVPTTATTDVDSLQARRTIS